MSTTRHNAQHAERTGVPWTKRDYKPGDAFAAGDDVNRLLSAANPALYGVCHAAVTGLGASPAIGFVHTGNALSFVLDIADLYKAEFTIPLAFDLAAQGLTSERDARTALRDAAVRGKLLHQATRPRRRRSAGRGFRGSVGRRRHRRQRRPQLERHAPPRHHP
ncbi:CRISPR-associated endonuclease Cas1 [Streptomyces mutabilis]|uniref:CRISPR-associated endonuclease Cas1 n=1 Tax=Streptomyces mutabilis TaxID=67332 RepID=UPI003F6976C0